MYIHIYIYIYIRTAGEEAAAADVGLADHVEDLVPLLRRHAAGADAAEAERQRRLARRLEEADLPFALEGLHIYIYIYTHTYITIHMHIQYGMTRHVYIYIYIYIYRPP